MPNLKHHKIMDRMSKIEKEVQLSGKKGIKAAKIGSNLDIDKSVVHRDLNSLCYQGKVYSDQGIWHAKTGEQPLEPVEKEITIKLPIPENQCQQIAFLDAYAEHLKRVGFDDWADDAKIFLEKFNETRTIEIKGKNVDNLDLEKIAKLIQQANEKSSKVNLKGLFKSLKRSLPKSKKH